MSRFTTRQLQAPDITPQRLGLRTPGVAGIQRAARSTTGAGDLVRALGIGLQAASSSMRSMSRMKAVDIGLGAETGTNELPAFVSEIAADDPNWEISVWDEDANGNLVARDQEAVRGDIMQRFAPYLEGQSDSYQRGFVDRVLPQVERGLYARGLQRRSDYLDMQLEHLGAGIFSQVASADRVFNEGGDPMVGFRGYLDQVVVDVASMFPQQVDESDEVYNERIEGIVYDRVVTPHVESLIGTSWGMKALGEIAGEIPPSRVDGVRDAVQRSYYTYLHERMATLQTGTETSFDLMTPTGEAITITSEADMAAFLQDPQFLNQDNLLSLTPAQRSNLLSGYSSGVARKMEQMRTLNAMNGRGLPGDSRSQLDALAALNLYDPTTGTFGGQGAAATGLLLANMRYPSPEVATGLLRQAVSRDGDNAPLAIQSLIVMAAHPDQQAFQAVADQAKTPQEQMMIALVGRHTAGVALYDVNGAPNIDSARFDVVLNKILGTPIAPQARDYTQEDVQNVGRILGYGSLKPEVDLEADVVKILTKEAGADGWFGADLRLSDPGIREFAVSSFIENVMIVSKQTPGMGETEIKELASAMTVNQLGRNFDVIELGDGDTTFVPRGNLMPDQRFGDDGAELIRAALEEAGADPDRYFSARPAINGLGWVPLDEFGDDILPVNENGEYAYINLANAREGRADGTVETRRATDGWIRASWNAFIESGGDPKRNTMGGMP